MITIMSDRNLDEVQAALSLIEATLAKIRMTLGIPQSTVAREIDTIEAPHATPRCCQKEETAVNSGAKPYSLAQYHITDRPLTAPQQAILSATATLKNSRPLQMHVTIIASLAGYSPSEKKFREALDNLVGLELISVEGKSIELTELGQKIVPAGLGSLNSTIIAQRIAAQLTRSQRAIFLLLFEGEGGKLTRSQILETLRVKESDSSFRRDISTLQQLSIVKRVSDNTYACADMIYIDS